MDPIANLLCCIRNGQHANKTYVSVAYSRVVWTILHVLYAHNIVEGIGIRTHEPTFVKHRGVRQKEYARRILIVLKSPARYGHTAIKTIVRVSSPKKRVYLRVHHLRNSMQGFGFRVVSTTQGIMGDMEALQRNLGGEVLCACV